MKTRIEKDSLGKKKIPLNAYFGIHTQRAFENFQISGYKAHPQLIKALAILKLAAAQANLELGFLDKKRGKAIVKASDEIIKGKFHDQFIVDVFQAGAGTPYNMNANEVIANRAIELLGGKKGNYSIVHPNDHVNMAQSSNDVFPTALRISTLFLVEEILVTLLNLKDAFALKARNFNRIIKSGRTHLQDAVPITLGQEFKAYSTAISKHIKRIKEAKEFLRQLNIGGTSVGTGINTHPSYKSIVIKNINELTNLKLTGMNDLIEGTQSATDFAEISSILKLLAIDLIRIANDLKLLNSGPRTGFKEIILPAVEPGSSIMPGKINPSMAEELNMACFQVIGSDCAISLAAQAGQLELNVMTPLIAYHLLQMIEMLNNSIEAFIERCVKGIKPNKKVCEYYFEQSLGLATALNPYLGYEKVAVIVKEAIRKNKTVREIILEKKLLSKKELDKLFNASNITKPNLKKRFNKW